MTEPLSDLFFAALPEAEREMACFFQDTHPDRCWFLQDGRQVLGFAWLGQNSAGKAQTWVCVHPAHRKQGHGRQLWEQVQTRAHSEGIHQVEFHLARGSLLKKLQAEGCVCQPGYRLLSFAQPPQLALPTGCSVIAFDQQPEPDLLLHLYQEAYQDQPGHQTPTTETIRQLLQAVPAQHIFLLKQADQTLGITRLEQLADPVLLDGPGLLPEHRSPDLQLAFLSAVCEQLQLNAFHVQSWGEGEEVLQAQLQAGATLLEDLPLLQKNL